MDTVTFIFNAIGLILLTVVSIVILPLIIFVFICAPYFEKWADYIITKPFAPLWFVSLFLFIPAATIMAPLWFMSTILGPIYDDMLG